MKKPPPCHMARRRRWEPKHTVEWRFYENKDVMGTSTETSTDYPQECPLFSSEVLPDGSMAKSGSCFDFPIRFQETAKPREHGNLTIIVLRQGMYHHSPNAGMRPFMVVIFKVLRHDIAQLLLRLQDEMVQALGLYGGIRCFYQRFPNVRPCRGRHA